MNTNTQQEPNIYVYENLIDKEQIVPITHPDFYTRVSDEPFADEWKPIEVMLEMFDKQRRQRAWSTTGINVLNAE